MERRPPAGIARERETSADDATPCQRDLRRRGHPTWLKAPGKPAKRDPGQVYTAMLEVKSMAGQGVVAQLTALIRTTAAEQTTQFQAAIAERTAPLQAAIAELAAQLQTTNARLDSVEKQLGRIWTFLFLLLGTLVGTLTTLLTTLLLRG